jgi:probable pyridine nucleotide-disulfide oxidoreductase
LPSFRQILSQLPPCPRGRIFGCTILSPDAAEVLGTAQLAMIAGLLFTALRDAVLSNPNMVEGFINLFAQF